MVRFWRAFGRLNKPSSPSFACPGGRLECAIMSRTPDFRPMAALFLGLCACGKGQVEASAKPLPKGPAKRVLLITCDSLRVDHMSAYGYSRPTTPNIEALAKDSITFTNAWS